MSVPTVTACGWRTLAALLVDDGSHGHGGGTMVVPMSSGGL
jgi:hypothetical protein